MAIHHIAAVLLLAVLGQTALFPPPSHQHYPHGALTLTLTSPCSFFHFPSQHPLIQHGYYFKKVQRRLNTNKDCQRPLFFDQNHHIKVTASANKTLKEQAFSIEVDATGIQIGYGGYPGYVYALETLGQLVREEQGSSLVVPYASIRDQPQVEVRGIMIDSARHFLSVDAIKRVIESMPLSRLNLLHWHIVDDESFPLQLSSHPELAQAGRYSESEVYSRQDVIEIVALAEQNGIEVVPEIDTPAHARSWGLSDTWQEQHIAIHCNGGTGYNGQLDLSVSAVFELAKDVIREVEALFSNSKYIHLGGDEVFGSCWDLRPAIKDYMAQHNLTTYGQLQMHWRKEMKAVLPAGRRAIFWRNDAQDVTTADEDILQYWGNQADTHLHTSNSTSQLLLSPSDLLYLNKGQGNIWLNASAGQYPVWKTIYQDFQIFPEGVNKSRILGGVVCLWGEVSNEDTLENNLWMRATAFSARAWSTSTMQTHQLVAGLVKFQYILYGMNVDASPVSSQFCEHSPKVCFPPTETSSENVGQPTPSEM